MALDPTSVARIYSASTEKLVAKTIDTVLNASPVTLRILGSQRPWKAKFPVKYQVGISGTSFDGLDKFSTALSDSFEVMTFQPTGYEINVSLSQMEVDLVKAQNNPIDIIAREMESRAEDMIDALGTLLHTLQTGKTFLSLINACDNETLGGATYGGLDRSTYGLSGIYTASSAAMTIALLRTKYANCTHGAEKPDIIVTSKTGWARYEALVITTTSYGVIQYSNTGYPQMTRSGIAPSVQALKGDKGFDVLWFSGCPIVVDEKCSANYLYMLNLKHLAFYGLQSTDPEYKSVKFGGGSIESVHTDVPKVTGFAFSGFNKPIDQYGKVGHIILMGNLIADSPRHQGIEVSYTS